MRDGSLDDVVGAWIDRMIQEHWGRNPGDNEAAVYFALMKRAAMGLLVTHARFKPATDYRRETEALLERIRQGFDEPEQTARDLEEMPEPDLSELDAAPSQSPSVPTGEAADYWSSETWKKDFFTSFSRWFWDMKDYALAAGRRKSDFLWDVAEVWVAVAASALVHYAKQDRERWFESTHPVRTAGAPGL